MTMPDLFGYKPAPLREADIMRALRQRYKAKSLGEAPRYVLAEHVTTTGILWGTDLPERIADLLVQDMFRTNGRQLLHGHEIKVTRSDWRAELRTPEKAEAWKRYCDKWWLVAPPDIVYDGELPDGWGFIGYKNGKLRVRTPAPLLDPEPMPTIVRSNLLRATAKTAATHALREAGTP